MRVKSSVGRGPAPLYGGCSVDSASAGTGGNGGGGAGSLLFFYENFLVAYHKIHYQTFYKFSIVFYFL
jgi:hypothetical protein